MKCYKCNKIIDDNSRFCTNCGAKVTIEMMLSNKTSISVKIASWIWLVCGILLLFGTVSIFIAIFSIGIQDIPNISVYFILLMLVIFTYALFHIGWNTLKGKAKDTLGNGIGSILFAISGIYSFINKSPTDIGEQIGYLVVSVLLLTAGILAFIARSDYKRWVSSKQE